MISSVCHKEDLARILRKTKRVRSDWPASFQGAESFPVRVISISSSPGIRRCLVHGSGIYKQWQVFFLNLSPFGQEGERSDHFRVQRVLVDRHSRRSMVREALQLLRRLFRVKPHCEALFCPYWGHRYKQLLPFLFLWGKTGRKKKKSNTQKINRAIS